MTRHAVTLDNLTNGPQQWYESIPLLTKYWATVSLATTFLGNMNTIPLSLLLFNYSCIKNHFEVWRFITPFLYLGGFSYRTAARLLALYQFSRNYENYPYNIGAGGGTADYAFVLLLGVVLTLLLTPIWGGYVFSGNLIYYVVYIWSKRNPAANINVFMFPLKANMFPFANLLMAVFIGDEWMDIMKGYVIGHVVYFCIEVVPDVYGKDLLHTPKWLIDCFGTGQYVPAIVPENDRYGGIGNNTTTWNRAPIGPDRVQPTRDVGGPNLTVDSRRSWRYNWGGEGRVLGSC